MRVKTAMWIAAGLGLGKQLEGYVIARLVQRAAAQLKGQRWTYEISANWRSNGAPAWMKLITTFPLERYEIAAYCSTKQPELRD